MSQSEYERQRNFLKDSLRKEIDFSQTDQNRGMPPPPIEKPRRSEQKVVPLMLPSELAGRYPTTLQEAIGNRESRRMYSREPISLAELSFLLWATQGVRQLTGYGHALRTVPSAGARHALETYLGVLNVADLEVGFYRYLPLSHSVLVEKLDPAAAQKIKRASLGQSWMATAAAVFMWSAVPYRMEWRYGLAAHRVILLDAGHVCQNLYLACEAIGAGACAVAAYDQEAMDQLCGIDGENEYVIYTAAAGKVR